MKDYNQSRTRFKYFDKQITAQFYGAKSVINGESLTSVARKIENGITEGSNRMGIQNFLFLFQHERGLPSSSKQMRKIYKTLNTSDNIIYPDELENQTLSEGVKKQVIVNAYERNSKTFSRNFRSSRGTVSSWAVKNEIPRLGRKAIEFYIQNQKNQKILDSYKNFQRLLQVS